MPLGKSNAKELHLVEDEVDLGIKITANLKPSKQCIAAYNKAVKILESHAQDN